MADAKFTVDYSDIKKLHTELGRTSKEFQNMVRSVDPVINATETFSRKVDLLNAEFKDADRQGKLYQRTLDNIRKQANAAGVSMDKFGQIQAVGGKNAKHFQLQIQQAGYQVGDFFTQVAMGQNPIMAFSTQMSQLAGFFNGPWGAAVGAGISIVGALAIAFMKSSDSIKSFDDQLQDTTDSLNDYFDLLKENSSIFDDVFSSAEESILRTSEASRDLIALAKLDAFDSITDLNKSLADSVLSASILKSSMQDVGDIINATSGQVISAGMGGSLGSDVREMYNLLKGLEGATTLDEQYRIATRLRDVFKENVDVNGEMTEEQRTFLANLSLSIQKMELLGASVDEARVSWSQTSEFAEATARAVELFYKNQQDSAEAAAETRDAVREIQGAITEQTKSLEQQISLNQLILQHGKDSEQVAQAKADIERENFRLEMQSLGIKGNNLKALMEIYDENVKITEEIGKSEDEAKRLESTLRDAVSQAEQFANAMARARSESSGIGISTTGIQAQIAALRGGASDPAAAAAGAAATLREQLVSEAGGNVGRGTSARIEQQVAERYDAVLKQETALAELRELQSDATEKSNSTEKDYIGNMLAEAEYRKSLIGLSEEQAIRAKVLYDLGQQDVDLSDARIEQIISLQQETVKLQEAQDAAQRQQEFYKDTLMDGMESLVTGSKSVNEAFRDMIRNMLLDMYRQKVMEPIAQAGSSFLSSLFMANGGAFNKGVQMFADGGVVNAPTAFGHSGGVGVMGEAGPEAIMPLKRGPDGKLGVAGSTGNVVVNQSFNFSANGDDSVKRIIAQAAPQIAQMTQKQIMDSRRRGGAMKATFS